jgi:hypothetical protein
MAGGTATQPPRFHPRLNTAHTERVSDLPPARWWSLRRSRSREPATHACQLCGEPLQVDGEHMLLLPEGDAGRRLRAHVTCALEARGTEDLRSREEWLHDLTARAAPRPYGDRAPGGEEAGETNGFAIASLFLGIIWLFGLGSMAAIVLGYTGMKQIEASGGHQSGRPIAIAGIVIGVVGLASLGVLVAFLISSHSGTPLLPGPNP